MNSFEQSVFDGLVKNGFEVLRRGWPDFLVLKKDWSSGFALEMKRGNDKLSDEQQRMHMALARFGIVTLTRREDFADVLRKRGKKLILPSDLSNMKSDLVEMMDTLKKLKYEIDLLEGKIVHQGESLHQTSALFDDTDPKLTELKELGLLDDSQQVGHLQMRRALRSLDDAQNYDHKKFEEEQFNRVFPIDKNGEDGETTR